VTSAVLWGTATGFIVTLKKLIASKISSKETVWGAWLYSSTVLVGSVLFPGMQKTSQQSGCGYRAPPTPLTWWDPYCSLHAEDQPAVQVWLQSSTHSTDLVGSVLFPGMQKTSQQSGCGYRAPPTPLTWWDPYCSLHAEDQPAVQVWLQSSTHSTDLVGSVLFPGMMKTSQQSRCGYSKAVNRGDKRTRRVRDRDFVKFERSRCYRDRYRCQEKKSRRGRALGPVFRDPPPPRTRARSLFAVRDSPPPPALCSVPEFIEKMQCCGSGSGIQDLRSGIRDKHPGSATLKK
jgi:hypothetical protein